MKSQCNQTYLTMPQRLTRVSLWFLFSASEIYHYLAMKNGGKLLQMFPKKTILVFNGASLE